MEGLALPKDKKYAVWINILALAIPVVVAILLNPRVGKVDLGTWTKALPHVNAVINSLTSMSLLAGFYFIKQKNIKAHRRMMSLSFLMGALFLVSYVLYHLSNESTPFGGVGTIRTVYYLLLASHISLSIGVVWFVLKAIYFALSGQFADHRRMTRWAFPIWLYVSTTGVIVYLLISPYYK